MAEPVEQAEVLPLFPELGVGGESRVVVTVMVSEAVTFPTVREIVVVPVDVLLFVTDPVTVGEPVSVTDRRMLPLGLRERRGVREASIVRVCVGEADRVLLAPTVLVPVAE
ncbi:MAG: hypothetical protein EBU85_06995 [Actinobacteria bacterium]|nr:hypothetical protein [Actinomycetota bacterium]